MSKFGNSKKQNFIASILIASFDDAADKITLKCKFNFGYMDFTQTAGQKFSEWDHTKLSKLLDKLHHFSKESLRYWQAQSVGSKTNNILEIYGTFPTNSKFKHPKHVPHQAHWARFRIGSRDRLIGFVIPSRYKDKCHIKTGINFDCNTFYVVFLDDNHDFYIT